MHRSRISFLVATFVILRACASLAQSPFDGTWKVSKSEQETKPFVFYLAQGMYHCESCTPPYTTKADGTDQPVPGQGIDMLSVKEVDAKTLTRVGKKNQKLVFEMTSTVSADGKTITTKAVFYPPNSDKPSNWIYTDKRVGVAPSGAHATSGKWLQVNAASDEEAIITTNETNGEELTVAWPTGETYTAKFDGKEYPIKGALEYDTVSLKRLSERSFEETDKLNGKVVEIDTWAASNDGKTLTLVAVQKPSDRKFTTVLIKVQEKAAKM